MKGYTLHRSRYDGFTLVELLIVSAILLLVSTSALLVLNDGEDQRRFEDTRARRAVLREALFGRERSTLNGVPVISGYLADVGALPVLLADLRAQPAGATTYALLGPAAKGIRLFHGWRGPYLTSQESNLSDAWGNEFEYTLPTISPSSPLVLSSLGKDGLAGGMGEYEADWPQPASIAAADYEITSIPLPRLRLTQTGTTPRTVTVGIIKAGLKLTENFATPDHPSLITAGSLRGVYTVIVPAAPGEVEIEVGRSFDLGAARQFQIAFYNSSATGSTLEDKLIAAHPQIFTALPRTTWVEPVIDPSPWPLP